MAEFEFACDTRQVRGVEVLARLEELGVAKVEENLVYFFLGSLLGSDFKESSSPHPQVHLPITIVNLIRQCIFERLIILELCSQEPSQSWVELRVVFRESKRLDRLLA